jgi:hypothetical protein
MKRASLNVVPPPAKTETTDLTDRLLAGEAQPAAPDSGKPKRRRSARRAGPPATGAAPMPAAPRAAPEPQSEPRVLEATDSLAEALRQAKLAAEALDGAARQSPARYHLGVRVRVDALAHHLRQVAAFIAGLGDR